MTTSLKGRFREFIKTWDGFEDIGTLLKNKDPSGKQRADYLLSNRTVIVAEQAIEADRSDQIQKYFDRLLETKQVLIFGTVPAQKVFETMPEGKNHQQRLVRKLTVVVERDISKADKQTRDTREIFSIPNATPSIIKRKRGAINPRGSEVYVVPRQGGAAWPQLLLGGATSAARARTSSSGSSANGDRFEQAALSDVVGELA
jgi:hypothetical protein